MTKKITQSSNPRQQATAPKPSTQQPQTRTYSNKGSEARSAGPSGSPIKTK